MVEVLRQLQASQIQVEVVLVLPDMDLSVVARDAVRAGPRLMIVSGGDGTIENVALGLTGSGTTLGIIPTGTRNNLARSLGIPTDNLAEAVALMSKRRRIKVDVGQVRYGNKSRAFLEAGAVELASALYPSADDIQHGDIGKIGEFLSTLLLSAPSEIRLRLDHRRTAIVTHPHLVLVANMPFMGANFQIAPDISFDDRKLDVFVYSDLNKLDLIRHAIQLPGGTPDSRIQRFQARAIEIATNPPMPVVVDGVLIGDGPVNIAMLPHRLSVIAGPTSSSAAVATPAKSSEADL